MQTLWNRTNRIQGKNVVRCIQRPLRSVSRNSYGGKQKSFVQRRVLCVYVGPLRKQKAFRVTDVNPIFRLSLSAATVQVNLPHIEPALLILFSKCLFLELLVQLAEWTIGPGQVYDRLSGASHVSCICFDFSIQIS